jgi:hypothetical protein
MPRVTKENGAIVEQQQAGPVLPEVPAVEPEQAVQRHVETIVRRFSTVLLELPLCDNPPGLCPDDPRQSYIVRHLNFQLPPTRKSKAKANLHRLVWALKEQGVRTAAGKPVKYAAEALVWVLEQLDGDKSVK